MKPTINSSISLKSFHAVTPFGTQPDHLWQACLSGENCFENGFGIISDEITEECHQYVLDSELSLDSLGPYQKNSLFDWTLFSLLKSLEKAGWESINDRDGIIISTTTSFIMDWEDRLINYLKGEKVEGPCYQPLGAFPQALQKVLNHKGPCLMVSSACSASTQAIGIAKNWMNLGYVDRCVVIGAEQLCHLTQSGFRSLSLVTEDVCHPFNEDFGGITLSEAAAVLCLEKSSEDNKGLSQITGYGCVSDAFSMTSPKPDGSGPARSMEMAINDSGMKPEMIDWVYAHGTGSLQNDRAEATALESVGLHKTPLSSSKAVHGHTLAASGALEIILSDYVLKNQQWIPSWSCQPEHFTVNLAQEKNSQPINNILKNTLGFGGINSSLIISRGGH